MRLYLEHGIPPGTGWTYILHNDLRAVVGGVLLLAAIARFDAGVRFPGWAALLPVGGTLLLLSAPTALPNRFVLASWPLRAVGLISYPLYLWHWPLLYAVRHLDLLEALNGHGSRYLTLALAAVLAVATYWLVERPIRFGRLRSGAAPLLGWGMAAVLALSLAVVAADGFSYRVTPQMDRIAHFADNDTAAEWREGECFLKPQQDRTAFSRRCAAQPGRPALFLWGDSHAAALYPGLRSLQDADGFGLAQYTTSSCPPLMGIRPAARPYCPGINTAVLADIVATQPQVVLLAGAWTLTRPVDLRLLPATIAALKQAGIPRIVLIGPAPVWKKALPTLIVGCNAKPLSEAGPAYSTCGLDPAAAALDRQMAQTAAGLGVRYVSLYDTLCNGEGCMTLLGPMVTAYDTAHLSPEASRYVVTRNAQALWP